MNILENDEKYMRMALDLAEKGRGYVKTNPLVGAVIVKDGKIIGKGYHKAYGMAHAEEDAINNASQVVEGATLYVNLEPCSHFGKRPPCADLLIKHRIKRLVVGCLDPNPKVAGRGIDRLRQAGIHVDLGILEEDCKRINQSFLYNMSHKLPYIVLKSAMTMDGKIASKSGDSKWISSEKSRTYVHKLRSQLDAIMVGSNTVLRDDPSLNVRLLEGRDPVRIIVDSKLKIGLDAKILYLDSKAKTIIATSNTEGDEKYQALAVLPNVDLLEVKEKDGHLDLRDLMTKLYQLGIGTILLEGGGGLNYQMLKEELVNQVMIFIAPKIIGGNAAPGPVGGGGIDLMEDSIKLQNIKIKRIEEDILVEADICSQE